MLRREPVNQGQLSGHDQVITFLDKAYSEFKWRNIGLIVHMCYEWGQRPVDIRNLTFSQIDWDKRKVDITQTKREQR